MRSIGYLKGRAQGRYAAILAYEADLSLDAWQAQIAARAEGLSGDRLDGFWRGAKEVKPERLARNVRARAQAANIAPDDRQARWYRQNTQLRRQAARRPFLPFVATLLAFGIGASTFGLSWRATHLLVIALCAVFIGLIWWVWRRDSRADVAYVDMMATPERKGRWAAAKTSAYWDLIILVTLIGGLALLGVAATIWR
jgi:cbb3-type cytochrome oxidase subunit 3